MTSLKGTSRYQLYGDRTTTPYDWVWIRIPSGMTSPAPTPAPAVPSREASSHGYRHV